MVSFFIGSCSLVPLPLRERSGEGSHHKEKNPFHYEPKMPQLSLFQTETEAPTSPQITEIELSQQQRAVRDFGAGNQVVVAGAGTGKTEVLTQRILKLLLEGAGESGPADLKGVLALTFTDKAAAEMRGRVYQSVVQRLRATRNPDEKARLETLRAQFFEDNRILTFDAFNRRLLAQFAEFSPLSPLAKVPSDADQTDLRREVARQFWAHAATISLDEKDELWLFLELFSNRARALDAISDAAQNRAPGELEFLSIVPDERSWRSQVRAMVADDLEEIWQQHELEIGDLAARWDDFSPRQVENLLDRELLLGKGVLTKTGWSAPWERAIAPRVLSVLNRKIKKRLLQWRDGMRAKDENDEAAWEREYRSRLGVAALAKYAIWWGSAAREWRENRDLADFDEVADAVLFVVAHEKIAARLREEIRFILIDEFQDTNARQWALIEATRAREIGNVTIVGDQKQAIYGFRGGDISVFDRVSAQLLSAEQKQQQLTESRRSTRPLVDWTNGAFETIFPLPDAPRASFEAPFQALQSLQDAPCGVWKLAPESWVGTPDENQKLNTEKAVVRAAKSVATLLEQLLDDAKLWQSRGEETAPNGLNHADLSEISRQIALNRPAVALLFATQSVKSVFEIEFRAREIPFVSLKGRGFYGCEAVRISLHLWRVLLDEDDRAAWAGLSRSPLGGLSDLALLEQFSSLPNETKFSRAQDELGAQQLKSRLENWRVLARVAPVSVVMERVLSESEIAFYEAGCADGAQREQNWRKLLDIVRARESEGNGGLRALIDFFSAMNASRGDEALAPLPADGSIQLLTAHSAKGLGFPMTILPQMGTVFGNDETGLLWGQNRNGESLAAFSLSREREDLDEKTPPPLVWQLLNARRLAKSEAEWKRLFYVACTRAQSHLVFVAPEIAKSGCWLDLARDAIASADETRIRELLPPQNWNRADQSESDATPILDLNEEPRAFEVNWANETPLEALCGPPNSQISTKTARLWLETQLRARGENAENVRQDVPFCIPGADLGCEDEWIIGALEWLAPLENGWIVAASGTRERAVLMGKCARELGLKAETWWLDWNGALQGILIEKGEICE